MVSNIIKWRPWPPLLSKKFEVKLVIKKMESSSDPVHEGAQKDNNNMRFVEVRWKGSKTTFRRSVKRDVTKEQVMDQNGVVLWDQEFSYVSSLTGCKENVFYPWEISFTVLNGLSSGPKNKVFVIGTASLNLADYASVTEEKEFDLNVPLTASCGTTDSQPSLHISLCLVELRAAQESTESIQSQNQTQTQTQTPDNPSGEKDEFSAFKAGLRKVKILKDYVSIRRTKKTSCEDDHEISESRSEEGDDTYPFDSDSLSESDEREPHENKTENATFRKSFCYGSLANANYTGGSLYENSVYYSHRKSDVGCSQKEDPDASILEGYLVQNSKRSILPWKKRKLNFKSPKVKGEPLLKKDNGEEGGDDIDFDRRQLSSDESLGWHKASEDSSFYQSLISDFGDDNFAVGNWEQKDLISRDGCMKLQTQVFFASIDQRSERAAGESACTALVAVIADWFANNHGLMPIKSQLDSLIREGSLEWRNLCENEIYRSQFPDKHFDLETVIQANIRPISVVQEKSFVGFFHPEQVAEGKFEFLQGVMSFDSMWDEISRESDLSNDSEPLVYIVSWNDHFFVLKVEPEAFYLIDSLGERLFEGCDQAYILKFDRDTTIFKIPSEDLVPDQISISEDLSDESVKNSSESEVLCNGKECCKEYIKNFLAAIPIRELEVDIKKGLISPTTIHQRLQIEFHYTRLQVSSMSSPEIAT
ncbi:EEIG1/EHBP1 N-terminal domain-containing protein [Tanacetum coccineum]